MSFAADMASRRGGWVAAGARRPVRIGVVGLGGYAGVVCDELVKVRREGTVRLVRVCDPEPGRHGRRVEGLRGHGVAVGSCVDELLADPAVEAVWLPLPIHLHRPFTERALAAGKAVLVEKPAAGCVQDVDAMIAARDRAGLPVAVGFQHLYHPHVLAMKRRILAGDLGRVTSASVRACWPRDGGYYRRAAWAGKLRHDGAWVLDGPANNAMAHAINLVLFLLGPDERTSAIPVAVESELYRANDIENYDTCSIRYHLPGGAAFLVLLTHAAAADCGPVVLLRGEAGEIRSADMTEFRVSGEAAVRKLGEFAQLQSHMRRAFARLVRSAYDPEQPAAVATLEVARAHSLAVNAASEAAPVRTVSPRYVAESLTPGGDVRRIIPGIEDAFARCQEAGAMLSESGVAPWASAPGRKSLQPYAQFAGPAV